MDDYSRMYNGGNKQNNMNYQYTPPTPNPKKSNNKVPTSILVALGIFIAIVLSSRGNTSSENHTERQVTISETTTEDKEKIPETEIIKESETEPEITEPIYQLTKLYLDFFDPYYNKVDKLEVNDFLNENEEKFKNYDVEITEGNEDDCWKIIINDEYGNHMSVWFFPTDESMRENVNDYTRLVETLMLLTYSDGEKEISVSNYAHTNARPEYHTFDSTGLKSTETVKNINDLLDFMFNE